MLQFVKQVSVFVEQKKREEKFIQFAVVSE